MLLVKKLHPDAILPTIAYPGDLYDLYALEYHDLLANSTSKVRTGIAIEFERILEFHRFLVGGKISGRSGLASRGIHPEGGEIDPGFRGELLVILRNTTSSLVTINKGEKIAQLKPQLVLADGVCEVSELSPSERGTGGFGSTGS